MASWIRVGAFLLAVTAVLGCAQKTQQAERARVSGKVTLDSQPLNTGTVTFDPQNGQPPAVFNILDGQYEGLAPVGKNRVILVSVTKVSLREKYKTDGPGYDTPVEENKLPDRYGNSSEIVREVIVGPNEFNFDLKSK